MAKKTWIKVKRGILEPRHIDKLGAAWYLYFYMLDNADWDTGSIKEWKDQYAADDLCKPLGLIREHRKKLESEKYISRQQNRHSQTIIIKNWTNPRMYDGTILNEEDEGYEFSQPCEGENFKGSDEGKGEGSGKGEVKGSDKGSGKGFNDKSKNSHSSSNHISHNHIPQSTDHRPQELSPSEFMKSFTQTVPHPFVKLDQPKRVMDLVNDFGEEKTMMAAKWAMTKNMRSMEHIITSMTTALQNGWQTSSVATNEPKGMAAVKAELARLEAVDGK